MARVDIDAFTQAINEYSDIVSAMNTQISALSTATAVLKSGILGEEESTQLLYIAAENSLTDAQNAIRIINGVINRVQRNRESYVKRLDILS